MEWIKIEDEKPYEYEMVLLVDNLGQKYYGTLQIEGENHFINDCCSGEFVTHWMPFPRLPKNQEDIMIFKFIKNLFCRHEWEYEESNLTGEPFKVCRKCWKEREIKK